MQINDILFKIKQALSLDNETMIQMYALADHIMSNERLEAILKRRQDKGYEEGTYEELGIFLDGLVIFKRGPSPTPPSDEEVVLTNNLILKKLRIALELQEEELMIVFALVDVSLTKRQIGALFRKEGHKNFKVCSDELLIAFLNGLDEFYYEGDEL